MFRKGFIIEEKLLSSVKSLNLSKERVFSFLIKMTKSCYERRGLEAFQRDTIPYGLEKGERREKLLLRIGSESEVAQSCPTLRVFATPWTVTHQAPPSMGFSRQEYWSGLPFPSPGDLPDPAIEPGSPAFQADALTSEPPEKPLLRIVWKQIDLRWNASSLTFHLSDLG